jgi:hypothetical protein
MVLEKTEVQKVLRFLNKIPECHAEKRWGNPYEGGGKPDITGCYKGRRFEFEAKRVGESPRKNQHWRLEEWEKAGAIVGIVYTLGDVIRLLELDDDTIRIARGIALSSCENGEGRERTDQM